MAEKSQGIGIALKMDEVAPLLMVEQRLVFQAVALAEICRNGTFATMSERRIAQVVSQTSRCHDVIETVQLRYPRLILILI